MAFYTTRVDESRALIKTALDMAYGSYVEQEGKKSDNGEIKLLVNCEPI